MKYKFLSRSPRFHPRFAYSTILILQFAYILFPISLSGFIKPSNRFFRAQASLLPRSSLKSNEPSLKFIQVYLIYDDDKVSNEGNNNHKVCAGETVEIMIQLENIGDSNATTVAYTNVNLDE